MSGTGLILVYSDLQPVMRQVLRFLESRQTIQHTKSPLWFFPVCADVSSSDLREAVAASVTQYYRRGCDREYVVVPACWVGEQDWERTQQAYPNARYVKALAAPSEGWEQVVTERLGI